MLLPVRLRQSKIIAWLVVLTWPVQQLYTLFKTNRSANLYRLTITPQVVYLERLLNDRYDTAERRITITDAVYHDPIYIYTKAESKPKYLRKKSEAVYMWMWQKMETALDPADFTISIPSNIQYQAPELRGIVDAYKLAGKTYSIATT